MEKKVLFALICAGVFGFAFSACSSDNINDYGFVVEDQWDSRIFDYISDIDDETGIVYCDYFVGGMYIDAANGNRYYLMEENELPVDDDGVVGLSTIERLKEAGILVDKNNVKFSGKVYEMPKEWISRLQWRLENYGWNEYARLYQAQLELPKEGHSFLLMAPDFTIENAE